MNNDETVTVQQFSTDGATEPFLLRGSFVSYILRGDGPVAAAFRLQTREYLDADDWSDVLGSDVKASGFDYASGRLADGIYEANANAYLKWGRVAITDIQRGPVELSVASSFNPIVKSVGPNF